MSIPEVSVIVPIYKTPERLLKQCVNSIKSQSLDNIQIILVDDGSPDNCGAICDEFAREDVRIIVIHKINGGLCSARNAGFEKATGRWITFVDADDFIESDMLLAMSSAGNATNAELVMCDTYQEQYFNKYILHTPFHDGQVFDKSGCEYLRLQLLNYKSESGSPCAKLYMTERLKHYNILHNVDLRRGLEGLEFCFRYYGVIERALFIGQPFYRYVYNESSITNIYSEETINCLVKCIEQIHLAINDVQDLNLQEEYRMWFYNRTLYVIVTVAISGYFSPTNMMNYQDKKLHYQLFLDNEIIKKSLEGKNKFEELSILRKLILLSAKHGCFRVLAFLGTLRRLQKKISYR